MAKDKQNKTDETTKAGIGPSEGEGATPGDTMQAWVDEFKSEGALRVNPDIWFYNLETRDGKPNPLCGVVLDRQKRKHEEGRPEQWFYVFALTRPCKLIKFKEEGEKKGEEVDATPGMFAHVDERWCVQSLQAFLPKHDPDAGLVYANEILIAPKGKVGIGGGKSAWRADVFSKRISAKVVAERGIPMIAPRPNAPLALPAPDDADVPF